MDASPWWLWLLTALSLVGTELNLKRHRACFWFWGLTNMVWVAHFSWTAQWAPAVLFGWYLVSCVRGWRRWRTDKET